MIEIEMILQNCDFEIELISMKGCYIFYEIKFYL